MAQSEFSTEFEFINWLRQRARAAQGPWTAVGIGDDCAILRPGSSGDLLVTTDMLMDGRHFRLDRDGPEAVGYKALAVNLSDIAAMAGIPRAALVSVALPRGEAAHVAVGLYAGMEPLAQRFAVDLVGGDTNAWHGPLVISVVLLGEPTARGPVRRAGARPGDVILVTGALGGSLFAGRHLRPEPRVAEAQYLHSLAPLRALVDISDGLSADLGHILKESGGLGGVLEEAAIPIHADARAMSQRDGVPALAHALHDGEDFELCLVAAPEDAERLLAAAGPSANLFRVGTVTREPGLRLRTSDGAVRPIEPTGFDHFRDRA